MYKHNQYNLDLIKAINADCDAIEDQNDCDEPDTIDTTPAIAKTVPLILTTTLQVILCQINMFCHQLTNTTTTHFVIFTQIVLKFIQQAL